MLINPCFEDKSLSEYSMALIFPSTITSPVSTDILLTLKSAPLMFKSPNSDSTITISSSKLSTSLIPVNVSFFLFSNIHNINYSSTYMKILKVKKN